MSESAEGSATDFAAMQRSSRGKYVALALLLCGAVAAIALYLRPGPFGKPEAAERVFVVPARNLSYLVILGQWGFEPVEGGLGRMTSELRDKVPGASETGVAAALRLADWSGHAFVAFEDPAQHDWSGLDIAGGLPTFEPHHRFAVVSAGDLAFPHVMTLNPKPSDVMAGPSVDLLAALFAQEPLASALRDDPGSPEIMLLRGKLEAGIRTVRSVREAEARVAKVLETSQARLTTTETATPAPVLLGGVREAMQTIALADGGLLLVTNAMRLVTTNGDDTQASFTTRHDLSYVPAGADPIAGRTPCTSLLGGSIEQTGARPLLVPSTRGDALVIHHEGVSRVYTLGEGGCNFVHRGDIRVPLERKQDPGVPSSAGTVARLRLGDDDSAIALIKPGDEVALDLVRSPSLGLHYPAWLDDTTLIAVSDPEDPDDPDAPERHDALLFFSTEHPDRALRIDAANFAGNATIHTAVPAPPGPKGPRLIVQSRSQLYRVDLPRSVPELFASLGKKRPPADGEPIVVDVDTRDWTFTPLVQDNDRLDMGSPAVAPRGDLVAFRIRLEDKIPPEIAVVPLTGGPMRVLTRNSLDDRDPTFTADGKSIVFSTFYQVDTTDWSVAIGRMVPTGT